VADHALLSLPRASRTWEAQAILPATGEEAPGVTIHFNRPVHIVGLYASLVAIPSAFEPPVRLATLDDIEAVFETDDTERNLFTTKVGDPGAASSNGRAVTLAALTSPYRYWEVFLGSKEANAARSIDLEITFRWKLPGGNDGRYPQTLVSLALFAENEP
jgi:hypothetical protein